MRFLALKAKAPSNFTQILFIKEKYATAWPNRNFELLPLGPGILVLLLALPRPLYLQISSFCFSTRGNNCTNYMYGPHNYCSKGRKLKELCGNATKECSQAALHCPTRMPNSGWLLLSRNPSQHQTVIIVNCQLDQSMGCKIQLNERPQAHLMIY